MHRTELLNESDFSILSTYQLEYRGLVEHDRLAYNLHTLNQLKWVMEKLTNEEERAHKQHLLGKNRSPEDPQRNRSGRGSSRRASKATLPGEGKPPLVATWGGIPLRWNLQANPEDLLKPNWNSRL